MSRIPARHDQPNAAAAPDAAVLRVVAPPVRVQAKAKKQPLV